MHKRKAHHIHKRLRVLPFWVFLLISLFFAVTAVFALRANNQRMIELRQAVFMADEQDGDVETALRELREFVYAHMNTDLAAGDNAIRPPIQLKYRYERLLAAEQAKLGGANEQLYTEAQNSCEQRFPGGFSGSNRIPCIKEYLDARGVSAELAEVPKELYMFDFASPRWSPDLAGWSIVLAAGFAVAGAGLGASDLLLARYLRQHA